MAMSELRTKLLHDYIQEESNALILRLTEIVDNDGYAKCFGGKAPIENLGIHILIHSILKLAAIMKESDPPDKQMNYGELVKLIAKSIEEIGKYYED
jgi:hypothetical protein